MGNSAAEVAFWGSHALIVYAYLGYPLLLFLVTRLRPAPVPPVGGASLPLPRVSIFLPAYNEERVIERRIRNLLDLDYDQERIEILVGCDGSTDQTPAMAHALAGPRVQVHAFPVRRGKTAMLNDLALAARGELLVFTDANCVYDRDALRRLVGPFRDPHVGAVIGELLYANLASPTVKAGEGLYWRYENAIKEMESLLGATLVANGSIYAMRKELFEPLPASISDDSLNPLLILRARRRVVFERGAIAREQAAESLAEEFQRKSRMVTRQLEAHRHVRAFLFPPRPLLAFGLISHKLVRWLVPFFLAAAMVACLTLLDRPLYRVWLVLVVAGMLAAAAGSWILGKGGTLPGLLRTWVYFAVVNAAAVRGIMDFLRRRSRSTWSASPSTR